MPGFTRDEQGRACLAGVPLSELLESAQIPTPAYLYDLDAIAEQVRSVREALGEAKHVIAYALKANSAGSVVRAAAAQGAGADVVSGAELRVAQACGIAPDRILISGVGKTDAELDLAISSRVLAVQVESVEEVDRVAARARALRVRASVSIRVNPSVEAETHAHIATGHDAAKFGVSLADVARAWERIDQHSELLDAVGVSVHVGSMLAQEEPYLAGARAACSVARARLASGKRLSFVDFGGGFGIDYGERPVAAPTEFARAAVALLRAEGLGDLRLVVEPGRSMAGPHGVLVASVVQAKSRPPRQWVVIDAGMNDLIRPALYQARHRIEPMDRPPNGENWRVVGPICESADDFGSHSLGAPPPQAVVIRDAGAYGFVMASEYNGRALPSEVFVAAGRVRSVSRSPGSEHWVQRRLGA